MNKFVLFALIILQSSACMSKVQEAAISVEHRIYCSENGSVVSKLTFHSSYDEAVYINKGFVAWKGQLKAASYELWDGSKFSGFKGIHFENINEKEEIRLLPRSDLKVLVDLDKYFEINRGVEYEMYFYEPAAYVVINGVKKSTPLKSNTIKYTVLCNS